MTEFRNGRIACAIAYAALVGTLIYAGSSAPDRVALHFNAAGMPNHWGTRDGFVWSMALFGFGLSGFVAAMFYLTRFLPPQMVNVPNGDYWRDPSHFPSACAHLWRAGLWFVAGLTLWLSAFTWLVVRANEAHPVRLHNGSVLTITAALLAYIALWSKQMIGSFRIPPPS